jgi:transposase
MLTAGEEGVGTTLTPDLNPIEQVFAKLRVCLRKAAARTVEALDSAIIAALATVEPDKCSRYFANVRPLTPRRHLP